MSKFVFTTRGNMFARVNLIKLEPNGFTTDVLSGFLSLSSVGKTHDGFVSAIDNMIASIYSDGRFVHLVNQPVIIGEVTNFFKDTVISAVVIREKYMMSYEVWDLERMALYCEGA